jgi:hypothetical protein
VVLVCSVLLAGGCASAETEGTDLAIDPGSVLDRLIDDDVVERLLRVAGPASIFAFEDETYYEFPNRGFSLLVDKNRRVTTIHYYLTPVEKYEPFAGVLPRPLSTPVSREEIVTQLGTPTLSGGNTASNVDGKLDPRTWIRYDHPTHSLHVMFSEDGRPDLVTLMTPEVAP